MTSSSWSVRKSSGDPIDCIVEEIPNSVMDTYCWIHSTFSLPKLINAEVGSEISNPGVGPVINEEEVVEHRYYQWVCFTLFLQVVVRDSCDSSRL